MTSLRLKASRNEQRDVIRFFGAKRLTANDIYSQIRPVYGDKCFTRRTIYVWCQSFLVAEKVLLMMNDPATKLWRRPTHRSQQSILSMNLDDELKNETLIWTFKLVTFVC